MRSLSRGGVATGRSAAGFASVGEVLETGAADGADTGDAADDAGASDGAGDATTAAAGIDTAGESGTGCVFVAATLAAACGFGCVALGPKPPNDARAAKS